MNQNLLFMPPGDVCSDIDLIREDDPLQHANPVPHYRILEHALVGFQIELATQIIGLCRDANETEKAPPSSTPPCLSTTGLRWHRLRTILSKIGLAAADFSFT